MIATPPRATRVADATFTRMFRRGAPRRRARRSTASVGSRVGRHVGRVPRGQRHRGILRHSAHVRLGEQLGGPQSLLHPRPLVGDDEFVGAGLLGELGDLVPD